MKVRCDFTLDVAPESLADLRELAAADTNADAAGFLRGEAEDALAQYLETNGISFTRTRSVYPIRHCT